MTILWLLAAALILVALAYLLQHQLGQAVHQTFVVLGGFLNTIVEGLRRALTTSVAFWQRHFGEAFGVRPLLGSLLLVGAFLLFAWADFALLRLTLASLLPFEEWSWTVSLAGRTVPFTAADVSAIAVIALGSLAGFLAFELLGRTDFMEWNRQIPEKPRKTLALSYLIVLFLICLAQAGLAVWRTQKLQEMDQAAAEEVLLTGGEGMGPVIAPPDVQAPEATEAQSWLDRLPMPLVAFFSFLIPLAAAVSAIGLYPLLVGAVGIGVAVAGLFPLLLMLALMTVLLNFIGYAGALAQALLAIPVRVGELLAQGIRQARWPVGRASERPPTPSTEAPRPLPAASTTHPQASDNGQDPTQDLEAVVEALNTNPFGVDDALLHQLRGTSPREERESQGGSGSLP